MFFQLLQPSLPQLPFRCFYGISILPIFVSDKRRKSMHLWVKNEVGKLKTVVLGIAKDFGGTPEASACYDPKSLENVLNGTYPNENDLVQEMTHFCEILERHDVEVLRPSNISGLNQIYARDIAFVIDSKLCIPNIIEDRSEELQALKSLIESFDQDSIVKMPKSARIEGGDVLLVDGYILIGFSEEEDFERYKVARTNREGVSFIKTQFPDRKVLAFELNKSDSEPIGSALHLDCCFQPVGRNGAIICEAGFKNKEDIRTLEQIFNKENIIRINAEEMYHMNSNLFSISEDVIVSQPYFSILNEKLRKQGLIVEEVPYNEVSKMGGLFRCSTMPLKRL